MVEGEKSYNTIHETVLNGSGRLCMTEGRWKYTLNSDERGGGRQVHIASPAHNNQRVEEAIRSFL